MRHKAKCVQHLAAELSTRTAEIEHLKLVPAKLRRMQVGRKSEKLDQQIEQLEPQLEDLEAEESVAEAQARPKPDYRLSVAGCQVKIQRWP